MPKSNSGPSEFTLKVIKIIGAIPPGHVASYQQVATLAGKPHASRAVAWILSSCSKKYKLPWHRVINSRGKISFDPRSRHFVLQKNLLTREKVIVDTFNGSIDLKKFQYKKMKPKRLKKNVHLQKNKSN